MIEYQAFYVQKSPQAFDETLLTFGLASAIQNLFGVDSDLTIMISDKGAYYEILLNLPLTEAIILAGINTLMPARALATNKTNLPVGIPSDHYETIRDNVKSFYEARKKGNEDVAFPPEPWDVYRAINPSALAGYNKLMSQWFMVRENAEALIILLDLYASFPNDFDTAIGDWKTLDKAHNWGIKAEATRQSLYNPDSGKGQNKSKADGLSIGNVSSFWLSEWLKALGFYEVALTKQLKGSKDRKTLVLAPRQFTFEQHQALMSEFKMAMQASETSIRFDVLASIRYMRLLLSHYIERISKRRRIRKPKQELVSGFHTAFYKDMGNAVATMNLSFIALPGWVVIEMAEDVPIYEEALQELEGVVHQFDESHSDDAHLLQHLRDFVSGDELRPFLKFTTAYASYYMRKRERGYAITLSSEFIERIITIMGKKLSHLADRNINKGFHNIAAAIATVTVWAQYNSKTTPYKVRYGLHRELARQAQTPEKFAKAIHEFIHSYNAETMRAKELGKPSVGQVISPADIDNLLTIIDDFGKDSQLVAEILLAYGSTFSKFVYTQKETN
ncbi:MAG: hypothetical protein Crog4KO_34590 [Crocinitomicaceae bacterium]